MLLLALTVVVWPSSPSAPIRHASVEHVASESQEAAAVWGAQELRRHCSTVGPFGQDVWIAVGGRAYGLSDVSGFLGHHPGGQSVLLDACKDGRDATALFDGMHPRTY